MRNSEKTYSGISWSWIINESLFPSDDALRNGRDIRKIPRFSTKDTF